MYICVCKAVTDHEICEAVTQRGITTLGCLARETGACTQCGKCARAARDAMQSCLEEQAIHRNILTNHFEEAAAAQAKRVVSPKWCARRTRHPASRLERA